MFEFIEGKLVQIFPNYIVMNVNGIGYKIFCPNPYIYKDQLSTCIICYVEQIVREDSLTLYGFRDIEEKNIFLTLNKVSGIGPKSALSILAAGDNQGLINAIETNDSSYLTKFPGVGKKTAQQMILDLSGQLSLSDESNQQDKINNQDILQNVSDALSGLGYSQREITKVMKELKEIHFETTQEGLSLAFKLLLK